MKYVKMLLVILLSLIIGSNYCKAESIRTGDFINNVFIKKINPLENNKTYYLQSQFIYANNNKAIYCVDPFRKISETTNYVRQTSFFTDFLNIDDNTWKKIIAAAYLGYGYNGHEDAIWYSITQVYIWRLMAPNASIYFTDTLNGNKTTIYDSKLEELDNMINKYYDLSDNIKSFSINYGETKEIELKNGYEPAINSSEIQVNGNKMYFTPNNLGTRYIAMKKGDYKNTYLYNDSVAQRLIYVYAMPYNTYDLYINITSGRINLNFNLEDNYHSICESNNKNIYGLYNENNDLISEINIDEIKNYTSNILNYGKYYVRQIDNTCQYEKDNNTYEINLNDQSINKTIDVIEKYKKVHINHNICSKNGCIPEKLVTFEFKNNKGSLNLITDEYGNSTSNIGYGTYTINQLNGDERYYRYNDVLLNTNDYLEDDIYLVFNSYLQYASLTIEVKDINDNLIDDSLICLYEKNTMSNCYKTVNGEVIFKKIKLGKYLVEQKTVDEKYILNNQMIDVDVEGNLNISIVNLLKEQIKPTTKNIVEEPMQLEISSIIEQPSVVKQLMNNVLEPISDKSEEIEEPILLNNIIVNSNPKTDDDILIVTLVIISIISMIIIIKNLKKIN